MLLEPEEEEQEDEEEEDAAEKEGGGGENVGINGSIGSINVCNRLNREKQRNCVISSTSVKEHHKHTTIHLEYVINVFCM